MHSAFHIEEDEDEEEEEEEEELGGEIRTHRVARWTVLLLAEMTPAQCALDM